MSLKSLGLLIVMTFIFSEFAFAGILPTSRGGTGANIVPSSGAAVYSTSSGMAVTSTQVFTSTGISTNSSVVLGAGTTVVNSQPLYITAGSSLATPQKGAIETDGTHLYWTNGSGSRKQLDN